MSPKMQKVMTKTGVTNVEMGKAKFEQSKQTSSAGASDHSLQLEQLIAVEQSKKKKKGKRLKKKGSKINIESNEEDDKRNGSAAKGKIMVSQNVDGKMKKKRKSKGRKKVIAL